MTHAEFHMQLLHRKLNIPPFLGIVIGDGNVDIKLAPRFGTYEVMQVGYKLQKTSEQCSGGGRDSADKALLTLVVVAASFLDRIFFSPEGDARIPAALRRARAIGSALSSPRSSCERLPPSVQTKT